MNYSTYSPLKYFPALKADELIDFLLTFRELSQAILTQPTEPQLDRLHDLTRRADLLLRACDPTERTASR